MFVLLTQMHVVQRHKTMKNLYIYTNNTEKSLAAAENIEKALNAKGIRVCSEFVPETEMIVVIGGDGAFLCRRESQRHPDLFGRKILGRDKCRRG